MVVEEPLRILHVVDVLSLAGMEYGVIKLVNRLDRDRFAPMICCLRHRQDVTAPLLAAHVPVFELRKPDGRDWGVVARLAALLREHRVAVVHSHNWPTYLYTLLAGRRARVPVVLHGEHGREAGGVPARRRIASSWMARWVTHLSAVNADIAESIVEEWGVPPDHITVVRNGVDHDAFAGPFETGPLRRELGLGPDDRVVLTVGGLRDVKDFPTLLRAFAGVARREPRARLLIVGGDRGSGMRERLEGLAAELDVSGRALFLGIRQDVPQLLSMSDVYVNSSVYEGMSNTILEAMAANRPVVATDVGGNPELVADGRTGFLVPVGDHEAMAERIHRVLADREASGRLGSAGRRVVVRRHSMAAMVAGYGDLYRELHARSVRPDPVTWRVRVARTLRRTGLNRLRSLVGAPRLRILAHRRVLPRGPGAESAPGVTLRDRFEAQLARLARGYHVLSLAKALEQARNGALPRRAVAIALTEETSEVYEHAWPLLAKYRLPATLVLDPAREPVLDSETLEELSAGGVEPAAMLVPPADREGVVRAVAGRCAGVEPLLVWGTCDEGVALSLAPRSGGGGREEGVQVPVQVLDASGLDRDVLEAVLAGWLSPAEA